MRETIKWLLALDLASQAQKTRESNMKEPIIRSPVVALGYGLSSQALKTNRTVKIEMNITITSPITAKIEFDPSNIPDKVKQAILDKIKDYKEEL